MLHVLPDWWLSFCLWLDNATVPLWMVGVVLALALAYAIANLMRELDVLWRVTRRRE